MYIPLAQPRLRKRALAIGTSIPNTCVSVGLNPTPEPAPGVAGASLNLPDLAFYLVGQGWNAAVGPDGDSLVVTLFNSTELVYTGDELRTSCSYPLPPTPPPLQQDLLAGLRLQGLCT